LHVQTAAVLHTMAYSAQYMYICPKPATNTYMQRTALACCRMSLTIQW